MTGVVEQREYKLLISGLLHRAKLLILVLLDTILLVWLSALVLRLRVVLRSVILSVLAYNPTLALAATGLATNVTTVRKTTVLRPLIYTALCTGIKGKYIAAIIYTTTAHLILLLKFLIDLLLSTLLLYFIVV